MMDDGRSTWRISLSPLFLSRLAGWMAGWLARVVRRRGRGLGRGVSDGGSLTSILVFSWRSLTSDGRVGENVQSRKMCSTI